MSIRLRLTLWYTGILSATLLLLGLGLYLFLHNNYFNTLQDDLQNQAETVRARIKPKPVGFTPSGGFSFDFVMVGTTLRNSNMVFQVVNVQTGKKYPSNTLAESDLTLPDIDEKKINCVLDRTCQFEQLRIDNMDFMMYYAPIYASQFPSGSDRPVGILQAGIFVEPYDRIFVMLRLILTVTALATIVLAASVGWFLARKALRPIEQVIDATNQIEKGADLQKRIEYYGPNDEIGELTSKINGMLGRLQNAYTELEEAYSTQRRFASDASHELRTPLTTIRGNVELLEKMWKQKALAASPEEQMQLELSLEAMHDISSEAERMSRLVGDLLALARADAGIEMAKTEIALLPLIEEVTRRAGLLPRTVEWEIGDLSALAGIYVYGSSDYLQQLVFIFIENAFKYTEEGYVRLDALRHDGQIGIRIKDTGIGMDKDEVPHIFDRFYRADESRGKKAGTGLGLSIAKQIIDEHKGSIEVKTLKDAGSTFIIWLPVISPKMVELDRAERHSLPERNQV
ncbi:sensor histidine kinase [Paenibacillus cremeus]|uniref:histidine kinase n=1 Tax=Paenibacillus cremeus TaxID=2163881 RepID=A0A559JMH4_9BACL|nr:HAMP domain-containing sensor histidine kinase [Paenibacillus cremeus]TVY01083.1 HAMP domain-containing histidine kinase [Paenibacillus cremeus]